MINLRKKKLPTLDNTVRLKRGKKSEYANQLMENREIFLFGIIEKQFRNLLQKKHLKLRGVTGRYFLQILQLV
jgi:ribosomal protein S4